MTARSILVYYSNPDEAQAYARLIRQPRRAFAVTVCSTPAEAAPHVADAEILYSWNFPRELLAKAGSLRWVQSESRTSGWELRRIIR